MISFIFFAASSLLRVVTRHGVSGLYLCIICGKYASNMLVLMLLNLALPLLRVYVKAHLLNKSLLFCL